MKKCLVFVLFYALMLEVALAQHPTFYLFSGVGKSLKGINYNLFNVGTKIKLSKQKKLHFNIEYYHTEKRLNYTYYFPNDYAYYNKRSAILMGMHNEFTLSNDLALGIGAGISYSTLKSKLNSSTPYLNEILLNQHQHNQVKLYFTLFLDYMVSKRSSVYLKYNKQRAYNGILPGTILSLGFCKGF
ncbi:MAG: hypothetical protein Q8K70_08635 [Bacteroidota bacterium]|nr:hypothetical protein [Bacteroidota bacterium]